MAKALLGHLGHGVDPQLVVEVRRLRERVTELEHEVARLRASNEQLASAAVERDLLAFSARHEPALT
jgi:cell division septum initiation protein DivIVA